MTTPSNFAIDSITPRPLIYRLKANDWGWVLTVIAASIFISLNYYSYLENYEIVILFGVAVALILLGLSWTAVRILVLLVSALSLSGIYLYAGNLETAGQNFLLKYVLSSQSAIMWMSVLYAMATCTYIIFLFRQSEYTGKTASRLTWAAIIMALTGMMIRWYESYLISPDIGHIPISNLYEVFILFCVITSVIYLYYETRYQNYSMGAFVLLVISAAVMFLLWYSYSRGANEIQPLVPALKSYWMKIHVPANFIGYGCFSMSAMLGIAFLLRSRFQKKYPDSRFVTGLPALELLDEVMYKSIALGFAFFTIATILGALWAAEAWGGYWSWDPKETWALIVWLNYAAWLHMRMTKGWHGHVMAWWSIIGLFVTLFAFLGVNMFLSGLHSYGQL